MTEEVAPVKRGPGRPRKVLQAKTDAVEKKSPHSLSSQMKAKPNWNEENMGMIDPANNIDIFHIDRSEWPEGSDLRWVREEYMGQADNKNVGDAGRAGWTPVHQSDFNGRWDGRWLQKGKDSNISYGGLTLMARPIQISERARREDARRAREQLDIKERALRGGDLPGVTLDSRAPNAIQSNKISRSYERISVPED